LRSPSRLLEDLFLAQRPNRAAIFLEVGYVEGEQAHVIVHAMRAREKS
jgi:hypothetical protein